MKKCRYPTSLLGDFGADLVQEAHLILSLSLPEIYSTLVQLYKNKKKMLLLCILRILLDIPVNDSSVVLVGWFFINNLIPLPTFYLFFRNLLQNVKTPEGRTHLILLGQSILPSLSKNCIFCNYLLSIPSLSILNNELFITVSQLSREPHHFESIDCVNYYIIPKLKSYYPSVTKIDLPPSIHSNTPRIEPKPNIFSSIEFASTLPPDEQRLYCVNLCLTYSPPFVRLHFPPLLRAACEYTRHLLYNSNHLCWKAFEIHPQLERMGSWICTLSIGHGPPPPLHFLNMTLLIRECAATGSLGHCLVFLNALFKRCSKMYKVPNPLTVSILSVLSSCFHVSNLRGDIKKQIQSFFSIFNADVELFYFRDIFIPSNSFDCAAQFVQVNAQTMFQSSTLIPLNSFYNADEISLPQNDQQFEEEVVISNDPDVNNVYFHYVPNRDMLPPDLKELCVNAERIEKYYFVDSENHFLRSPNPPKNADNDQEMLQCLVSLALADSPILAKNAARLFKKKTKDLASSIDLCPLFRCAFPNRYILSACLERKCFSPSDVNSLFSELLTNVQTAPIVRPIILSFTSICFQFYPNYPFNSLCEILGIDPPFKNDNRNSNGKKSESCLFIKNKSLPPPLKIHSALLKSFFNYITNKNEKTRSLFFQKVSDSSVPQINSLVSFVFSVTKKQNKQFCSTKIDYSAIDELCLTLGKCANRIYSRNNDKFISSCFEVAKSIAPEAPQLLLFRFVYGLITHVHLRKTKEPMIDLLENNLHPSKIPSFAVCWLQLIMHRAVLPYFLTINEERPMQFCLNCIITAISLLVKFPEVFYRGVTRILLTIASVNPYFFNYYFQLLIGCLPLNFIQIRNIILSVLDDSADDFSFIPLLGFNFVDELKTKNNLYVVLQKTISSNLKKSEFDKNASFITDCLLNACNAEIKKLTSGDQTENNIIMPKIIWQFVLFSINETIIKSPSSFVVGSGFENLPISRLFIHVQKTFSEQKLSNFLFYNAIIDQLRYPNRHTSLASSLIDLLFASGDSNQKELIIVCLIKRLLCVTQPPKAVSIVFKSITLKFGSEIKRIFKENGESDLFESAVSIVNAFAIKKSHSQNNFI